jgi:hypothetical protein
MFIQVFGAKVRDVDFWEQRVAVWRRDIKPVTEGFLGFTSGVTSDLDMVTIVRFRSAELASADSAAPAQSAWFEATSTAFAGPVMFHDCVDVDVLLDGGSDRAGFVQVLQARAKDQDAMRAQLSELEPALRAERPDLMGTTVAWHGDGGFTMASYFTSEVEARANEATARDSEINRRFRSLLDGVPVFLNLSKPEFD